MLLTIIRNQLELLEFYTISFNTIMMAGDLELQDGGIKRIESSAEDDSMEISREFTTGNERFNGEYLLQNAPGG